MPELDAALGGGFVTAAIHELIAPQDGVAAHSLALHVAARAAGRHKWIFYIDTQLDLYPPGVAQLGVSLGRLMIARTPHVADALWVCEQVLRCRAVAAVVLPLRTLDGYASRRLQLAAEAGGGPTFAASRLRCTSLAGEPGVRRMLITVLKVREGRPGEPFAVEWPDAPDSVPAHSIFADGAGVARRRLGG